MTTTAITVTNVGQRRVAATWPAAVLARYPARPVAVDWPATRQERVTVWERLTSPPFVLENAGSQGCRVRGTAHLLDWLADQPGETWQERWLASGADAAGSDWQQGPTQWHHARGGNTQLWRKEWAGALVVAMCADLVRPTVGWLVSGAAGKNALAQNLARTRDGQGFAQLRAMCDADPGAGAMAGTHTTRWAALIVAAKGGTLADITLGDVLELLDAQTKSQVASTGSAAVFYRMLHQMGIFDPGAPTRLRALRTPGQLTPDELIDRYHLACRPVRDLLVDYLRERQPRLDYNSLTQLAYYLGKRFWQDLEHHNPGIDSLHLPAQIAAAWKERQRTKPRTTTTASGEKIIDRIPRIGYRQCLTPVRAFYLDVAQWAMEEPGRWGPWAVRCPIGQEEIGQRKLERHRKARMDARTRERLPVVRILVSTADQRRKSAHALLQAARQAPAGTTVTAEGLTLTRCATKGSPDRVWALDLDTGKRRDLAHEESQAFWSWAAIEVLRLTGVRREELLEISHHSLIQYRLPTTGELVPLLQIAPSKTDEERLLVVSPELSDVLSTIIRRVREPSGAVPLVPAYDPGERVWRAPTPLLFQRPFLSENRAISDASLRTMLNATIAHTGLIDLTTGHPLHYTPHDFRRIFITDAIMSGLPPHIAQIIAGHRDINVTLGYKAVYPQEAIAAHLAFLARRRQLRPSEEYRTPTDAEWQEFLGHFERRKVATGTCGRAFSTPCIHEHACLRCAMHWPDPAQRPRLVEIRDNLIARISEAEREGWLGEVEGLKINLAGASDKLAQVDRHLLRGQALDLGLPVVRTASSRTPNGS